MGREIEKQKYIGDVEYTGKANYSVTSMQEKSPPRLNKTIV